MKTYNELFTQNQEMPPEAFLALRAGFIKAFRDDLVGRQLLSVRPLPASAQSYAYDRISTEPGKAAIIGKGAAFPIDEYDSTRTTVAIPKIGWGFKIPREDFLAGIIQNQQVDFARRRVAEKEDDLIFNGDSDFGILGLLNFVNNATAAGTTWASATVANIYADVKAAYNRLLSKKVPPPYHMVVNPSEAVDMLVDDATSSHVTAKDLILKLVADIRVSFTLPSGTVLVMGTGSDIAQLGVAEDLTLDVPRYDDDRQEYRGRAYERLIPIVYQYGATANKSDALTTITGA